MRWKAIRRISVVPLGLGVLLLLISQVGGAQSEGSAPSLRQDQPPERDRLAKQVAELREAGKFNEAIPVVERILELERRDGSETAAGVADALGRLAELHELNGHWDRAVAKRKEPLAVRERVDGKDHWRTADARLAVAFGEKVAGLKEVDRSKLQAALGKEQEATRLLVQGKSAEAEREALVVLEIYKVRIGPETAEAARMWHAIGRARLVRDDAPGAKEATGRALAIRRRTLPANHPDLGRSLNNLGATERLLGNHRRAKELLEEAIKVWRASLDSGDLLIVMGWTNLAGVHEALGDYAAALKCHEEALTIRRKALPEGHPDIVKSLDSLGNVQKGLGNYAAAKRSYEEVVSIRRLGLPRNDLEVAYALIDLGNVQNDLEDYPAAKASHSEALAICRKSRTKDHPDIAVCLHNLGIAQRGLGDLAAARASSEESLAIYRKILPASHPTIASSLYGLGLILRDMRDYASARKSLEEALAIYRGTRPADHPDIAMSLNTLGNLQRDLGDDPAARRSYEEALALYRKTRPADHPDISTSLTNLGTVQRNLGDNIAARRGYEEALAIYRKSDDARRLNVASTLDNLGWAHLNLGANGEGRRCFEEALAIRRKSQRNDHPDTARTLANLGEALRRSKDYPAARSSAEQAVAILRRARNPAAADLAMSLSVLGAALTDQKDFVAAKRAHQEALALYRKTLGDQHLDTAWSLHSLGVVCTSRAEWAAAKSYYEAALAIRRSRLPRDSIELAGNVYNLGQALFNLNDYPAARKCCEEAVATFRRISGENAPETADALSLLGLVLFNLNDLPAARGRHTEALAIRRKLSPPNDEAVAESLLLPSTVLFKEWRFDEAKPLVVEALALFRRGPKGESLQSGACLLELGIARLFQGDPAGKGDLDAGLALWHRFAPEDHTFDAVAMAANGTFSMIRGEFAESQKAIEGLLALQRRTLRADHPDIADTLSMLANVAALKGDIARSRALLEEALALQRRVLPRDHPKLAETLRSLGGLPRAMGDPTGDREYLEEALAIRRKALPKDHPDLADSLLDLASLRYHHGDLKGSIAATEEALAVRRKASPRIDAVIAGNLEQLGRRLSAAEEYARAKVYLEEAVALARRSDGKGMFSFLSRFYLVISLLTLSEVHSKLGEHAEALRCLEEVATIQQQLPNVGALGFALTAGLTNAQGRFESRSGDRERAIRVYVRLLRDWSDQLERAALAQSESEQLKTTTDFGSGVRALMLGLLQMKETVEAYSVLLRWKGVVTAQQRWARLARNRDDARTADLVRELGAVDQQLLHFGMTNSALTRAAPPDATLKALTARREKLERDLTYQSAAYRREKQRTQHGPAEIIASLPRGTALIDTIEYLDVDLLGKSKPPAETGVQSGVRRLGAFVLRSGAAVQWVDLGPSAELAIRIDRWCASYGAGKSPDPREPDPGTELRSRIWVPLIPLLGRARTVLISPDGPLNGLPWAALPGSQAGTFLIQEYSFAVIPSPQSLPELIQVGPRPATEQPSLVLAGGIDFGREAAREPGAPAGELPSLPLFKPLAGTDAEVNNLDALFRRTFPPVRVPAVLRGDRATKQAVLSAASSYRFVHLATHGFFAGESEPSAVDVTRRADPSRGGPGPRLEAADRHPGLLSGLVFAGVNRPDRPPEETILTALEAAELNLDRAELVVLSACDTGRGRVAGGEGVLGLQRAFQVAGARTVVASLWQVPDTATQALMTQFYRNLWEKRMGKLEALRESQLWLLKEGWRHSELNLRSGLVRPDVKLKEGDAVSPFFWAAFVLSGDWR
jgi:tetratricopeptide (TPR) repeat protein/CHAT domain-containing protein